MLYGYEPCAICKRIRRTVKVNLKIFYCFCMKCSKYWNNKWLLYKKYKSKLDLAIWWSGISIISIIISQWIWGSLAIHTVWVIWLWGVRGIWWGNEEILIICIIWGHRFITSFLFCAFTFFDVHYYIFIVAGRKMSYFNGSFVLNPSTAKKNMQKIPRVKVLFVLKILSLQIIKD